MRANFLASLLLITLLLSFPSLVSAQVDPISGTTFSNASAGLESGPNVLDNNPSTFWGTGNFAPGWIELRLPAPTNISRITLQTNQYPRGRIKVQITGGINSGLETAIFDLDRVVDDGEVIDIPLLTPTKPVQYVRITTTTSPSYISWREIKLYAGTKPTDQHYRYFGYFGGPSDFSETDYTNFREVANGWGTGTNTRWVLNKAANDIADINKLASMGIKSSVDISPIFFGAPTPDHWIALPNAASDWQAYWTTVSPYADKVLMFSLLDEPDLKFPNLNEYGNAIDIISHDTAIPILTELSYEAIPRLIDHTLTLPSNIKLLSFDEYNCWDNCYGGLSIPEKIDVISQIMRARNGKIWLTLDGLKFGTTPPTASEQNSWIDRNMKFVNACISIPECEGTKIFIWNTIPSAGLVGVQDMPSLAAYFRSVGAIIKSSNNAPSVSPTPGDLNSDGHVDIFDYNLLVSKFGNPYTIFDYNNLVGNFGE